MCLRKYLLVLHLNEYHCIEEKKSQLWKTDFSHIIPLVPSWRLQLNWTMKHESDKSLSKLSGGTRTRIHIHKSNDIIVVYLKKTFRELILKFKFGFGERKISKKKNSTKQLQKSQGSKRQLHSLLMLSQHHSLLDLLVVTAELNFLTLNLHYHWTWCDCLNKIMRFIKFKNKI